MTIHTKLVIGLLGTTLSAEERAWLRSTPPAGIILFARNASSPQQLRYLIDQARSAAGTALPVAIDEEGGRVNRLPWPPFQQRPSAADFGKQYASNPELAQVRTRDDARRCGEALAALGITHNCAPVLDLRHPEGHAVIGNRSFGSEVEAVAALGRSVMTGLAEAGVEAVGKHFPGHGRANCDSHQSTPEVIVETTTLITEARPFATLINAGLKHVMMAHVRYPQQDEAIASCSPHWIKRLRTDFDFRGTIWSDDLSMGGAGNSLSSATQAAHHAGNDRLLVCQPEDCRAIFRGEITL